MASRFVRVVAVCITALLFLSMSVSGYEAMLAQDLEPFHSHSGDYHLSSSAALLVEGLNDGDVEKRQRRVCRPGTSMCADGVHCVLASDFCCPDNMSTGCRRGTKCCPGSDFCARSDEFCCPNTPGVCKVGETCCPGGGANCAPSGGSCCGVGFCKAGDTCCNGNGCASSGASCCGRGRQCPKGTQCCKDEDGDLYCAATCVPSLIFPYVKGLLDEIYENMCKGVAASSRTDDANTDIVTLDNLTSKNLTRAKAGRRRKARCIGANKLRCPAGYSCDEFPFASSLEGGSGAKIMCVPRWQNDWQGTYYNEWLREMMDTGQLKRGGQFRIKMKGVDCSQFKKRDERPGTDNDLVLATKGNVTIMSARAFGNYSDGRNAVMIPLTEDQDTPGKYTVDYSLSGGRLVSGAIVDDEGEPFGEFGSIAAGDSEEISVDLEEDYGDISLVGWTEDEDVDITYTVEAAPSSGYSVGVHRWTFYGLSVGIAAQLAWA